MLSRGKLVATGRWCGCHFPLFSARKNFPYIGCLLSLSSIRQMKMHLCCNCNLSIELCTSKQKRDWSMKNPGSGSVFTEWRQDFIPRITVSDRARVRLTRKMGYILNLWMNFLYFWLNPKTFQLWNTNYFSQSSAPLSFLYGSFCRMLCPTFINQRQLIRPHKTAF